MDCRLTRRSRTIAALAAQGSRLGEALPLCGALRHQSTRAPSEASGSLRAQPGDVLIARGRRAPCPEPPSEHNSRRKSPSPAPEASANRRASRRTQTIDIEPMPEPQVGGKVGERVRDRVSARADGPVLFDGGAHLGDEWGARRRGARRVTIQIDVLATAPRTARSERRANAVAFETREHLGPGALLLGDLSFALSSSTAYSVLNRRKSAP